MTSQEENKDTSGSEEDQMKRRLTEAGIFEDDMTLKDMKDIIGALDESAKYIEENNVYQNSQPRTPSVSPPIQEPVNVSSPEASSENSTEIPKMSYSNVARSSKSPTGNVAHEKRDSTDRNSASEATEPKENTPMPKTVLKDWEKKALRRKKISMDPLKILHNENDVLLRQPERPFVTESEPFSFCNDLKNSKFTPKELVQKVSDYLQEVRDELIAHTRPKAEESDDQWGAPIKVGSCNFSLDKKSVTRSELDVEEPAKDPRSRASKRKAASLIASITNVSDSDLEPDDDESLLKKRKSQQEGRNTTAGGCDVQMDVDFEPEPSDLPSTSSFSMANQYKIDSEEEDIFESSVKSKSPEPFVPRRIIPPNPGTNKARRGRGGRGGKTFKGPRAKKSSENANKTPDTEAPPAKKSSPPEIVLDNDTDVFDFDDVSKATDMKMLKIPMKERQKLAQQKLEDMKNKEKQQMDQKKSYEEMCEEKRKKEKKEILRKRFEDEEKARRLAKEKEEKANEKKKMWNKVLNHSVKQKKEKSKGMSDEEVRRQLEDMEDDPDVVVCDEQPADNNVGSTSENRVTCPICNRRFPESEIENHASECNQFDNAEEDTSRSLAGFRRGKNKNKCNVCDAYETYDPNDYIEHTQICIEQDRHRKASTVCTFRYSRAVQVLPVNEIEYEGQFSSGRRNSSPEGRRYN